MAFRKGQKFNGVNVYTPGVYSNVTSDMLNTKSNGALNIALLGEAKGGVPGELMVIDDPEVAKQTIKGGELLTAMLKAYDPVMKTKVGVALGGADRIFAIRTNQATKAKTAVYQDKAVGAKVGDVVKTLHPATTGEVTVSGEYTGTENKTFQITITSEGTKTLKDAKYRVGTVPEGLEEKEFELNDTSNATNKELADGIKVTFGEGNYTEGDVFLIPCTAAVNVTEYAYTVESKDFGAMNNLISHKLDDGTVEGTKKLVIYDGNADVFETFDNVGGLFHLRYVGKEPYADLSVISDGKGKSIKLITRIGQSASDATVDLNIDLDVNKFKTMRQLMNRIASYENYSVTPVSVINSDLNVNDLDVVDKVQINQSEVLVTALLKDLQKTAKNQSKLVNIEIGNSEVSNFENYDFTSLTGGTEGRSPDSWIKFLDELSRFDIDYIVPLTDDLSIVAETQAHVELQSGVKGKERRMIWGGKWGLSSTQAINNAKKTANPRVQYVGVGGYDLDGTLLPGYILAAMHAGRVAFLGTESATADIYTLLKPEKTFTDDVERRDLIDNGVIFFDEVISDFNHEQFYCKLVWDYTTFTEYNDPLLVERCTGALADKIIKDVRRDLDQFLTGKVTPTGVLESARNRVLSILKGAVAKEQILDYRNVTIKKVDDTTFISFEIAATLPNNFTLVTMNLYSQDIDLGTI